MSKLILHMLSPLKHMSPFDVNMALDAGYDSVTAYCNVTLDEVAPLVQDAMFSRSPKDCLRTGVFIAGKDVIHALDMLEIARKTLLSPFEISVFADPAGSFTTAAAMVACVEKVLKEKKKKALAQSKILVFGATGVVGFSSGIIAALEGADVTFAGHDGVERALKNVNEAHQRFDVSIKAVDTSTPEKKLAALKEAEVVLAAGPAGVRVLTSEELAQAPNVCVAADVNAVPPYGIEGIELKDNGKELSTGVLAVGPLAIGDIKYKAEAQLFRKMTTSEKSLILDFRDAFVLARTLV